MCWNNTPSTPNCLLIKNLPALNDLTNILLNKQMHLFDIDLMKQKHEYTSPIWDSKPWPQIKSLMLYQLSYSGS